jgi:glycosyltransferase involved in cell wall biosynthesis
MAKPSVLFLHQNFPGQFRHIAVQLAQRMQWNVVGLADARNTKPQLACGVQIMTYTHGVARPVGNPYLHELESRVSRGQSVLRSLLTLRERGFTPDVVCSHPSWGESLFVREVFPRAKLLAYCEFYYHAIGSDVGFDVEFDQMSLDDLCLLRMRNTPGLMALAECDAGWSPTHWQASQHPALLRDKITVVHEGIDTSVVRPNEGAVFDDGRLRLSAADTVITYVARNLEPYRGFHVFMRALPKMLQANPEAKVVIVGGDEVSYGKAPKAGGCWRVRMLDEIGAVPGMDRVHFLGRVAYKDYINLLQVSTVHAYLTYPFVLSWSMLEAMAAGCVVVASSTAPVTEVIEDGVNGVLTDFFDVDGLCARITAALRDRPGHAALRERARATIVERYDLNGICVPRQLELIGGLL